MQLEDLIRKHALKNAFDYGKANAGAVVGKVIAEFPDAKKDMKETMGKINSIIAEINGLGKDKIASGMSKFEYAEKPKEEKKTIEVAGAEKGKVIVRYPPEPNGWPHIGHAKAFCLSSEIAKNYDGKIILRWDDTNPEAEKKEFIEAIKEGVKWVGLGWDEEKYCSDYLPQMYELCEKLIREGNGYFCTCGQGEIAKGREEKKRCTCGSNSAEKNIEGWKGMLDSSVKEGEATIRLRGDMESNNTVMRDPTLFRIITAPHYRQGKKYRVWPTYDFQGAVMDSILGITHPIRSKEYELRDEAYVFLLNKLGMKVPSMLSISRLAIKNAPISKRLLRPLVESKKLSGWDDPRLPTLAGLKARGVLPEAIKNFVLSFGLSKVESEPTWEALLVENRKLLDPISKHYFFVPEPVKIKVKNAPEQKVSLKLHPKNESMGTREIETDGGLFIPKKDFDLIAEGEIFRLKDLYNAKMISKKAGAGTGTKTSGNCEFAGDGMVEKKIQWATKKSVKCEVLIPKDLVDSEGKFREDSLEIAKGICENACLELNVGDIIQFERFGFCRLEKKAKTKLVFVFSC